MWYRPHYTVEAIIKRRLIAEQRALALRPNLKARESLLISFAGYPHVVQKPREFIEPQRLRPINQRLARFRMEVHEDHVGSRNHSLCGDVHDVEDAFRPSAAGSYGVRRINADRHSRQSLHHGNVSEVDEISVRRGDVSFHSAQAK